MATEIDIKTFHQEFRLLSDTSPEWIKSVLKNFSIFISDHAANERKAAATCMDFVVRYPNHHSLVATASRIAEEELSHFRDVFDMMVANGYEILSDTKDVYISHLREHTRHTSKERLLDRLLLSSLIEMRGTERFKILANEHPDPEWKEFYRKLYFSEKGHGYAFYHEALKIFPLQEVNDRFKYLIEKESDANLKTPATGKFH
jgi:tRNA-(ms[2]io[6]A)-hydroxylase